MNRKTLTALTTAALLTAAAANIYGAGQTITVKLDTKAPGPDYAIETTSTTDPQIRAYILERQMPVASLAGWSAVLYYGTTNGLGIAITNTSLGANYIEWQLTKAQTATNGNFASQIVACRASDGAVQEWGRGRMILLKNPQAAYVPFAWGTSNGWVTATQLAAETSARVAGDGSNSVAIAGVQTNLNTETSARIANDATNAATATRLSAQARTNANLDAAALYLPATAISNDFATVVYVNAISNALYVARTNGEEGLRLGLLAYSNYVAATYLTLAGTNGWVVASHDTLYPRSNPSNWVDRAGATSGMQVAGSYLTSEADTLETVAARGGTVTNSAVTFDPDNLRTNTFGGLLTILGVAIRSGGAMGASGALGATALGYSTTASGNFGATALGYNATASHNSSFTWSGGAVYGSHGNGTFNVSPIGGAAGFYIGETNLVNWLLGYGYATEAGVAALFLPITFPGTGTVAQATALAAGADRNTLDRLAAATSLGYSAGGTIGGTATNITVVQELTGTWTVVISPPMFAFQQIDIVAVHSTSNQVTIWPAGIKIQTANTSLTGTNTTGFTDFYTVFCRGSATSGTLTTNLLKLPGQQ